MWRKYHRKNSKWNTTRTKKRNRGQGKWAYQEVWRWYITSIDEKGYPRTYMIAIAKAEEFLYIYFITPKCSPINGKATHFEKNLRTSGCYYLVRDNVTLVVNVEFIEERET